MPRVILNILIFSFFSVYCAKADLSEVSEYDIVVAADGTGNLKTLQEAINSIRAFKPETTTIFIKKGTYNEKVEIHSWLQNIRIIGEDVENTIITWNDYSGKNEINTFTSYTIRIQGNDIVLENLTIENTEGLRGQAVALHVEGDRCAFVNCHIQGNQDTVYLAGEKSRHYFYNCNIEGTTDFIFGSATSVFKSCTILCKKHSYITAASTPENKEYGFVFIECDIKAAPEITKVYLGRPWRDYANVVFKQCQLGNHIRPEGWHNWSKPEREKTAFYAEYQNKGPGANISQRVKWSKQLTPQESLKYTAENILSFDDWKAFKTVNSK